MVEKQNQVLNLVHEIYDSTSEAPKWKQMFYI